MLGPFCFSHKSSSATLFPVALKCGTLSAFSAFLSAFLQGPRFDLFLLRSSTPMIADDSLNDRLPLYH